MIDQRKNVIIKQFILMNIGESIDKTTFAKSVSIPEDDLDLAIAAYIDTGNVVKTDDKYCFSSMYFYDYLKNCDLNEEAKSLILKRIHGSTLQDIADDIGKTRETARLEEKNALKLIEDGFVIDGQHKSFHEYLFLDEQLLSAVRNVKYDKDFYVLITDHHPEFAGARYFLSKFKKEPVRPDAQINIINAVSGNINILPKWFIDELISYYHPVIIENGAVFSRYDGDALTEILKLHGPLKTRDLMDIYSSGAYLLNGDDEIEGYDKSKPETADGIRYFTYIYPLHSDVIRTGKHGELRYYNTQKYKNKIEQVIKSLKYPDGIRKGTKISTKDVFDLNTDMLAKINIKNEYELHSLMRCHKEYVPANIHLKRIPMIEID